jgi:hypothetical protein
VLGYDYQQPVSYVDVLTDSDWAGEKVSRKSTSGGVVKFGNCLIKSWSNNQKVIALSSAEAEYYAMVKGTSHAIGIQSMMADLGVKVKVRLSTDASAAKGIASRRGIGKIRHLEVSQLWLQDMVQNNKVMLRKIKGDCNPADLLTKQASVKMVNVHFECCNMWYQSGRHELMPQVSNDA